MFKAGPGSVISTSARPGSRIIMNIPRHILPVIVISQFCCTSLWFAGNGVMGNLIEYYGLTPTALGHLTAAVQLGFISGTLIFALFTVADRYSPSRVFFVSALLGSIFNLGILLKSNDLVTLALFRFASGFFLAGIYPVGMKIAADYFEKGLGKSLAFLVGALVLGTALPHLLKGMGSNLPWAMVIWLTSALAVAGGGLMLALVPDGPFRKQSPGLDFAAFFKVFRNPSFRAAAFGYFGHMWELYAFWAFVPLMLETALTPPMAFHWNTSTLAFLVIGIGGPGCVLVGYLSGTLGTKRTAGFALAISCACCLLSPVLIKAASLPVFFAFLLLWGTMVVADSPLFSTLVARNSLAESKGTALTIVNCIGFAITIFSIQLLNFLRDLMNPTYIYMFLALGPVIGLLALFLHGGSEKN